MQAINLWLSSAGLLTHIARLIIGKLQAFASAECIKSLSPLNSYKPGTYQHPSLHAPRYDYETHSAVRNRAHPESTTLLVANHRKSVSTQAGTPSNNLILPGSWEG